MENEQADKTTTVGETESPLRKAFERLKVLEAQKREIVEQIKAARKEALQLTQALDAAQPDKQAVVSVVANESGMRKPMNFIKAARFCQRAGRLNFNEAVLRDDAREQLKSEARDLKRRMRQPLELTPEDMRKIEDEVQGIAIEDLKRRFEEISLPSISAMAVAERAFESDTPRAKDLQQRYIRLAKTARLFPTKCAIEREISSETRFAKVNFNDISVPPDVKYAAGMKLLPSLITFLDECATVSTAARATLESMKDAQRQGMPIRVLCSGELLVITEVHSGTTEVEFTASTPESRTAAQLDLKTMNDAEFFNLMEEKLRKAADAEDKREMNMDERRLRSLYQQIVAAYGDPSFAYTRLARYMQPSTYDAELYRQAMGDDAVQEILRRAERDTGIATRRNKGFEHL